jgi:hypothetical protein
MGRQFRALRSGGSHGVTPSVQFVGPALATSSSVATVIPNYGVTDMSTWPSGDYVMAAPVAGVQKTLLRVGGTTAACAVWGSTAQPKDVLFGDAGTSHRKITFQSSVNCAVQLIGLNATAWAIVSQYPQGLTANTTAVFSGTS